MAELKTTKTGAPVEAFLQTVEDDSKRQDCVAVLNLMKKVTGEEPRMWGTSIIGLGDHHYKYASGHEGDTFLVGFSPRKQNLTLYINGYLEQYADILQNLGKHKTGKGCLYIKKLEDVNLDVLEELISRSIAPHTAQESG